MTLAILELLVDADNGNNVVTATNVVLTPENCRPMSAVSIAGVAYFVEERLSTTTFRLVGDYLGADDADMICQISPFTPEMASRAVLSQQLTKYEAKVALLAARGYGLFYNLVANSGANDPGPGNVSVNDNDWSQVTEVRFDVLDAAGIDATPEIDDWSNGTELKFESIETGAFAKFKMTGAATNQGPDAWRRIVLLEYIGGSGALAVGEALRVVHVRNGAGMAHNARVADLAARAAHDGAAQGFAVLVEDIGDARTAIFEKKSATSGDWSGAALVTGPVGATGPQGWSPNYDLVDDGERMVKKLVGYVGGAGTAPTENIGEYLATAGGYTATIALAKDVRGGDGPPGPAGALTGVQVEHDGNYTLVIGNKGDSHISTSANPQTFTLDPPATLLDGWVVVVKREGAGVLILDGDGATIDGEDTLTLALDDSFLLVCDGTKFRTELSGSSSSTGGTTSSAVAVTSIQKNDIPVMLAAAEASGEPLQLPTGFVDAFSDDTMVDSAASTNEQYDDVNDAFVTGQIPETVELTTADGTIDQTGFTIIDLSATLPNDETITHIGMYQDTAKNYTVKLVIRNSANNYDVVVSESFAHPGGGWFDHELASPYEIPGAGDYYIGGFYSVAGASRRGPLSWSRAYIDADLVGTSVATTAEDSNSGFVLRYTYLQLASGFDLVSLAKTIDEQVNTATVIVQLKENEAITINSDVVAKVSRDDGATQTTGLLDHIVDKADGTKIYAAFNIDISEQPDGTDMRFEISVLNSKDIAVAGAGLFAEPVNTLGSTIVDSDNELMVALAGASALGKRIVFKDGVVDPFASQIGVDIGSSVNQDYDAAGDFFSPSSTGTDIELNGNNSNDDRPEYTYIDLSQNVPNSVTVSTIGVYSTYAETYQVKIVRLVSGNDYDVVHTESFDHPGGGWADKFLSSSYDTAASGQFNIAAHAPAGDYNTTTTISRTRFSGDATGNGVTFVGASGTSLPLRYSHSVSVSNMTLVSNVISVATQPEEVDTLIKIAEPDAITINTDLTVEISRGGGIFSLANLSKIAEQDDGSVTYSATVDVSSQAAGTDLKWRVKTLNNKSVVVHGIAAKETAIQPVSETAIDGDVVAASSYVTNYGDGRVVKIGDILNSIIPFFVFPGANNAERLQAAIDSAASEGRSAVSLPSDMVILLTEPIDLKPGVSLIGNNATLKVDAGWTGTDILRYSNSPTAYTLAGYKLARNISNITLDCSHVAGVRGLYALNSQKDMISNIRVIDCIDDGIVIDGGYEVELSTFDIVGSSTEIGGVEVPAGKTGLSILVNGSGGSDHSITQGNVSFFPIGAYAGGGSCSWSKVHAWSTYAAGSAPMLFGFLIDGEGNQFASCIADSIGMLNYANPASFANGGYGFYVNSGGDGIDTRITDASIIMTHNVGAGAPATGTIQPIYLGKLGCSVNNPRVHSYMDGVEFLPVVEFISDAIRRSSYVWGGNTYASMGEPFFHPALEVEVPEFSGDLEVLLGGANVGMTYTSRTGYAKKMANGTYLFTITIQIDDLGSSTGLISITGAPAIIAPVAFSPSYQALNEAYITGSSGTVPQHFSGLMVGGSSTIYLAPNNSAWLEHGALSDGATIAVTGTVISSFNF